jgi:phospholipase/carboxylesterase
MKNRRPKPALRQAPLARAAAVRPPRHALPGIPHTAGVFVPQGYEPGYPYPLLVWLPDPRAAAFDLGRAMARVSLRNFVAAVPAQAAADDASEAAWDAIEAVRTQLSVHADRIYVVGVGAGGTQAFRIVCRQPEAFAGVVSLGGAFPLDEGLFARVERLRRLPMLLCCRRDDDAAALAGTDRTLRLFHAAGATLALRIYPGCADLSKPVLADVNRWLMEDVCGPTARQPAACGHEP